VFFGGVHHQHMFARNVDLGSRDQKDTPLDRIIAQVAIVTDAGMIGDAYGVESEQMRFVDEFATGMPDRLFRVIGRMRVKVDFEKYSGHLS
jgi:hypothetical protein